MKKRFMRMISMLVVFVMTLAMCVTGFAASDSDNEKYTITVENSIGGIEYNVFKVFDVSYNDDMSAISYTITRNSPWYSLMGGDNAASCPFDLIETAVSGIYTVTVKKGAEEETIAAWFNNIESFGGMTTAADAQEGNGQAITFELTEAGYYLVVPSSVKEGSHAVSLTTTNPNATVVDKNQKPGQGGDEGMNLSKSADGESYSIGDTVTYTISSYVPTYDGDEPVTEYIFTDTMGAGLTLDGISENSGDPLTVTDNVKVVITGTDSADPATSHTEDITEYCEITVSYDGNKNTILVITWKFDDTFAEGVKLYPADAVVTITYTATVNENADDTNLHNDVALTWIKGKETDPDPDDEVDDEEDVFTYGFQLEKVDGGNEALKGASFTLKDDKENEINFIYDDGKKAYEVFSSDVAGTGVTGDIMIDMADDGTVYIWGLGAGEYTLTEITAPSGYNLLTDTVKIVIEDGEGVWTVKYGETTGFDEEDPTTYSTVSGTIGDEGVKKMAVVTIQNLAGTLLPGTGGIGTTIFYIVGTFLVLAAAALVVAKWRLGKAE